MEEKKGEGANAEKHEKGFGEGIEMVKDAHPGKDEKDIEINFDFGKALSFFRGKKGKGSDHPPVTAKEDTAQRQQHAEPAAAEKKAEDSEEGELDIGKLASGIKGILKGKKEGAKEAATATPGKKHEAGGEDEVALDLKSAAEFMTKRGSTMLMLLGILIAVVLTAHVRLQPPEMHFTEEWARNSVYNTIQNDLQSAINAQYPNLPAERKSQILAQEASKAKSGKTYTFKTGQYAGQQININDQLKGTAGFIKDFYRDENGKPYSPDIDPYYWNRYAQNIIDKGHIGDEERNGVEWDNRQVAPLGREILLQDYFFPYFLAYLYKAIRPFSHSASLWWVQTAAYPVLVTSLTVLLVFLIGRKLAGNTGGFLGALMAGLHSAYVNRTIHGDNDAVVIFFAILTLWLFVQAIYEKKLLFKAAFAALAGFTGGVYSIAWGGWLFVFVFIMAASAATVAAGFLNRLISGLLASEKKPGTTASSIIVSSVKDAAIGNVGRVFTIPAAVFFAATGLFVTLFSGKSVFINAVFPIGVTKLKTTVLSGYWPNVLTTVAELNEGSFQDVVRQIQPEIFWIAALSAVAMTTLVALHFGLLGRLKSMFPKKDSGLYAMLFGGVSLVSMLIPLIIIQVSRDKSPFFQSLFQPQTTTNLAVFWIFSLISVAAALLALINFDFIERRIRAIEAKEKNALYAAFFATLIAVWFIGTIYASTKGVRFILLLAPMAGLGFGITLGLISKMLAWVNENFVKINKAAVATAVFIILAAATYSTDVKDRAYSIANNDVPIINDAWHDALTEIKNDSNESAIITSWWDFGHHFKSITGRRVTFDGTTQQYPPAHWVGRFFMTRNETEAAGILRMLDCGSNSGFDRLYEITKDFGGTVKIIYKLTATPSKEKARSILAEHGLTGGQAEEILKFTHCNPPEGYVIASEDMIGKSGVWGHFGSWDFERAIIWQSLRGRAEKDAVNEMKRMFNYSEEKAKAIYTDMKRVKDDREANTWIAPWPSFSGDASGCNILVNPQAEQEKIAACGNGLIVNLTTNEAYFPAQGGGILRPVSFIYLSNETGTERVVEKTYADNTVPQRVSVIFVPQGGSYIGILASPEIAGGMFTKMFFFEGKGLKHFRPLTHKAGLTGTNIYVYKADWESLGKEQND